MLQVCLDGPSGSGKSTIAKRLAKDLHITYLDTGAMYRALTYFCLESGVNVNDEDQVTTLLTQFKLDMQGDRIILNDKDISESIRLERISQNVSAVSSYAAVRQAMVDLQRKIANDQPIVMDGRDIGTVVLPHATYKFYIDASPEVRAQRRYNEQKTKGLEVEFEQILQDMILRDEKDSTRKISPLSIAADAIKIDTSDLDLDQVIALLKAHVKG